MTVRLSANGGLELIGHCPSEDAEVLLEHLLRNPDAPIDWRGCEGAHSAVIQLLMAAKAKPLGPPADPALARWVEPVIAREAEGTN